MEEGERTREEATNSLVSHWNFSCVLHLQGRTRLRVRTVSWTREATRRSGAEVAAAAGTEGRAAGRAGTAAATSVRGSDGGAERAPAKTPNQPETVRAFFVFVHVSVLVQHSIVLRRCSSFGRGGVGVEGHF